MITFFPSRTIALSIGIVDIHWYGLMYLFGFLIGAWLVSRLQKYRQLQLSSAEQESLFLSVFLGVLLGGRLGFVLFYGGTYYLENPLEILAVWHGGMSSHGGFVGVLLALMLFTRKKGISLLALGDVLAVPIAIGLALGRLGNFINGELYGTLTDAPWGLVLLGADGLRHPTQLYAMLKDLLIAAVCMRLLVWSASRPNARGLVASWFLILYAILRFLVEIYREQPYGYTEVAGALLSRGQLLTLPILALGILLLLLRQKV